MIKIFIIYIILLNSISCSSAKNYVRKNKYQLKKYKSKKYFTGIVVESYDNLDENLRLPATVIINNVFLEGNVFNLGIGYHNIEIIYPSKKNVRIKKIKINQKDSLIIKTILQDANIFSK